MNKKGLLGGLVIVVAAITLVGPRFAGSQVEETLKQHVKALNGLPAYNANIVSFDRGWFGSTAKVELGINTGIVSAGSDMPESLSFEVQVDVQHGPVLTRLSPGLGLAAWEAHTEDDSLREWIEWEDEKSLYHVVGRVGLLGDVSYSDSISSFSINVDDQQLTASLSEYEGHGEASSDRFSYRGGLDNVEILFENHAINLSEMTLSTEAQSDILSVLRGELYEARSSIDFGKVIVRQPDDVDLVNLQDLGIEFISAFGDKKKTMDIDMNYSVKAIKTDGMDLSELTLNTAFNSIDTEFLYAYNQTMQEAYGQEPEEIEKATKKLIKENLPQLLSAEPEFVISEVSGEMSPGHFNGNLSAKLVNVSQVPESIYNLKFWVSSLLVDASIAIEKPLLLWFAKRQVMATARMQYPNADESQIEEMAELQGPMVIDMYLQKGLLKEAESEYRTEFKLENGEAVLNGQRIPLANML